MKFFDIDFEAAIFDMDGTMFDTERLRMKMLKQASLEIFGIEISDKILIDSLGVSAVTGESLAKNEYGDDFPYQEIRKKADELEVDYVRTHGVPIKKGLYNLLERLKRNQVFIALATSSRREIAEEYLIRAKVLRYFDVLVCGDEVEHGKPHPEIFTTAIHLLSCTPDKCIILEDSKNGIIAARDSGAHPVFIKDMKDLPLELEDAVFKKYVKTTDFLKDIIPFTQKMPVPDLYESFPICEDDTVAGIHGFGAIGGGYLAQIFSHWDGYTRPGKIIGASRDSVIQQLVNSIGKYQVKYESVAYFQTIPNVEIIDMTDEDAMISMYEVSSIIGLALPEKAIQSQAELIARGLIKRYDNSQEELTILVLMNKINAARYVKRHVTNTLKKLVTVEKSNAILEKVHFSETVVNRMVSMIPADIFISKIHDDFEDVYENIIDASDVIKDLFDYSESQKKKRRTKVETNRKAISISKHFAELSIFAENLSNFNLTLFSSEPDMALYASRSGELITRLRQIEVIDNIKIMQEIKNKLSNGTHAIIAWYGTLLGYDSIGQSMGDPKIKKITRQIMNFEIKPALLIENPEMKSYIHTFISNFIKRCRVSFKDKCTRVGRDPMRKLQNNERVIGAIQLVKKHDIDTKWLEFGAACGIIYALTVENVNDKECEKIREIYSKNHSIEDILTYHGPYNRTKYKGLDKELHFDIITNIKAYVEQISSELNISLPE